MKSFAFTVFALEIFFALIYGFRYNFSASTSNNDYNGLFISMFLAILLLVGNQWII